MHEYRATISWQRGDEAFVDNRYSRVHTWSFDGGVTLAGSASPQVVRPPFSDPSAVDPEEAFVAALSSCHLLWFLNLAALAGVRVDGYVDEAAGFMEKDSEGEYWLARVELRPRIVSDASEEQLQELHHEAHRKCYLARSVKTEVVVV